MTKPTPIVWIVELWCGQRYEPTVGIGLSREDGRMKLARWKRINPHDKFRLVPYETRRLKGQKHVD